MMNKLKMMKALLDNLEQDELNAIDEIKLHKRRITLRASTNPTLIKLIAKNGLKLHASPLGFTTCRMEFNDIEVSWVLD